MITETAYLEPTATTAKSTMVATDQSTDFTNCENKSETLNVVTNGAYSFRATAKLNNNNETENELDYDNVDTDGDDVTDYGRPKKLQKSLTGNNLINQLDCDFSSLKTSAKPTTNPQLRQTSTIKLLTNSDSNQSDGQPQQTANNQSSSGRRKQNLIDNEFEDNFECLVSKDNSSSTAQSDNSPKVPPLRIVISSSTAGRNSKDLNQNSNNYVVSTSIESSSNSNDSNKKDSADNFYLT